MLFWGNTIYSQSQKKLALVIGNSNYEDPNGVLKNPVNDSKLMSETFIGLEFDSVIVANNLSYDAMRKVFRDYRSSLKKFDVGFIYYSGHGMQDAYNETYLIPIDFPANSTIDDVTDYGYSIQDILKSLNRYENKLNVFVLDACRDNPYEKGWKGRSLKGGGLSEPQVPPTGSLVAYSTSPGDVASDNSDSDNSLYTKALSEIMKQPNLKIEEVFKRVRNVVYSGSKQNQNPQWWGQLEGDLYLLLKEDYSKIEIKNVEKAAEKLKKEQQYIKAIDQCNLLELYFKNNIQNIDKRKLLNLYFDMGEIYFRLRTDSNLIQRKSLVKKKKECETRECWDAAVKELDELEDKYTVLSSESYLNALVLFDELSINKIENKELYSKILFNYLWSSIGQGVVEYSLIESLIEFNIINFSENDYRTALTYYIYSWHHHDIYKKYKLRFACADLILNNDYSENDINKYMLNSMVLKDIVLNSFIYGIDAFNDNMKNKYYSEKGNDTLGSYKDFQLIENAYSELDLIVNSDEGRHWRKEGIYKYMTTFYHNYPIYHYLKNEDELNEYCIRKSLEFNNKQLEFKDNASDSCWVFLNNIVLLDNLCRGFDSRELDYDSITYKKKLSITKALNFSLERGEYTMSIKFLSDLEDEFFYNNYKDSIKYSAVELSNYLDKINNIFPSYMSIYRKDDNQDYESEIMWDYFIGSEWNSSNLKNVFDQDKKIRFLENWLEYVLNTKEMGYGSFQMVEVKLKMGYTLKDYGENVKADRLFIEMINDIDQKKHTWSFDRQPTWRVEAFKDLEGLILAKYLDVFSNYVRNFGIKYSNKTDQEIYGVDNINRESDSLIIIRFEELLTNNKQKLLEMNYYYHPYDDLIYAKTSFDWFVNTESVISSYDMKIDMYNELKSDSSKWENLGGSPFTIYSIETALDYAFGNKLMKLKGEKQLEYRFYCIEEAKKWEDRDNAYFILGQYDDIVEYYIDKKDEKNILKYAKYGVDFGENYLKENDLNNFSNPKLSKAGIMKKISEFYQILSDGSFSLKTPSKESRLICIDYSNSLTDFINKNWNLSEIKESEYLIKYLYKSSYMIADNYWWLHEIDSTSNFIDSTMKYNRNYLRYSKLINDYDTQYDKVKHALKMLKISYSDANKVDSAVYYYKEYVDHISWLDEDIDNNFSYRVFKKSFSSCDIDFLEVKVRTVSNVWPVLEFDINYNQRIDSLIDKRYFISREGDLNVEYIKTLTTEFGSYMYDGFDSKGIRHDTTYAIIFDKSSGVNTNAYVKRDVKDIAYSGEFGGRAIGSEIIDWLFVIPLSELVLNSQDSLRLVISGVTLNSEYFRQSRLFDKHVHPLKSYFSGFEDAYKIDLNLDMSFNHLLHKVKVNTSEGVSREENINYLDSALLILENNKNLIPNEKYVEYKWQILKEYTSEFIYDDMVDKANNNDKEIISFLLKTKVSNNNFDYQYIIGYTEYMIARRYFDKDNFLLSEAYYLKAFSQMNKNGEYLNNYAWLLVVNNKELEKAFEMSSKSVKIYDDRDYFWDTYASILYKLSRFAEAEVAILKALELNRNKDQEYLEKAGDIYLALENNELALKYWGLAVDAGGKNTNEIKNKLKSINN